MLIIFCFRAIPGNITDIDCESICAAAIAPVGVPICYGLTVNEYCGYRKLELNFVRTSFLRTTGG